MQCETLGIGNNTYRNIREKRFSPFKTTFLDIRREAEKRFFIDFNLPFYFAPALCYFEVYK
jgi:hypothetical protein